MVPMGHRWSLKRFLRGMGSSFLTYDFLTYGYNLSKAEPGAYGAGRLLVGIGQPTPPAQPGLTGFSRIWAHDLRPCDHA